MGALFDQFVQVALDNYHQERERQRQVQQLQTRPQTQLQQHPAGGAHETGQQRWPDAPRGHHHEFQLPPPPPLPPRQSPGAAWTHQTHHQVVSSGVPNAPTAHGHGGDGQPPTPPLPARPLPVGFPPPSPSSQHRPYIPQQQNAGEQSPREPERRESANVAAARLTAQAEEQMRLARAMVETAGAEAEQGIRVPSDAKAARGDDGVEDDLSKRIQELLVTVSHPPPPPPPRPPHHDQVHSATASTSADQIYFPPPPSTSSPDGVRCVPPRSSYLGPHHPNALSQQPAPNPEGGFQPLKEPVAPSSYDATPTKPSSTPKESPEKPPSRAQSQPSKLRSLHVSGVTPVLVCIKSPANVDVDWFVHDEAPDFLVCSRCYVDNVHDTALRNSFTRRRFEDFEQVPRRCFFGSDRVKKVLWPAALAQGNLDPMRAHMKSRPGVEQCPGTNPQRSREWWTAADVPGMSICHACYEDDIQGGPFASRFRRAEMPEGYICDTSVCFVARMYNMHSERDDWETFASECRDRIKIPACPGSEAVPGTQRTWLSSKRGPAGLVICYACYGDYFYGTANADYFVHLPRGDEKTMCLLGQLNLLISAQQAIADNDPELFWRSIEAVDKNPACTPEGLVGPEQATWYTLPNNPPDFAVCGACHAGIAEPAGWAQHLVPKKPEPVPRAPVLCSLNPAHPRFGGFMNVLGRTMITANSWEPLGEYAAVWAGVPRCPRSSFKTPPGRRYWGWDSLHICHECYLSFAKGTALEPSFAMRGEVVAASRLCDLYSPRMRALYTAACDARDKSTTLESLLDFAHRRRVVYIQTVPEMERLRDQQTIMALEAQSLGVQGTVYKSMGWSHDAVVGHSYTVGNAYAGYGYENEMVLQGAVYDKRSREMSAAVTGGGFLMQMQMLEQQWRAVE